MSSELTFHLLDCAIRDEEVVAETEDAVEVAYETASEASDDEYERPRGSPKNNTYSASLAQKRLVISLFGSTASGRRVVARVRGFTPFFYVEVPGDLPRKEALRALKEYMKGQLGEACLEVIGFQLVKKKRLFGYTKVTPFNYIQVSLPSAALFQKAKRLFLNDKNDPVPFKDMKGAKLGAPWTTPPLVYEANLDPLLRFLHLRNLSPCNWVSVEGVEESSEEGTLEVDIDWTQVSPTAVAPAPTAPFVVASWDIEVWSSTGEFPLAQRSWSNCVRPFYLAAFQDEEKEPLDAFSELLCQAVDPTTDEESLPAGCYKISIQGQQGPKRVAALQELLRKLVKHKDMKEGFKPLKASGFKDRAEERDGRLGTIGNVLEKNLDGGFPLKGDPVIQIGTIIQRLGSAMAAEKHIFVLGSCSAVPDAVVHVFEDEAELIKAWCAFVVDVDIFIGYNIFGFDERYMWNRMEELGITEDDNVQALNRLEGSVMKLEEKRLSSSAMGDNFLYLWTTTGRLRIDVFHHIKRSAALASYKLDDTSRFYLSEDVADCTIATHDNSQWTITYKPKKQIPVVGAAVVLLNEEGANLCDKTPILAVDEGAKTFTIGEPMDVEPAEVAKWAIVKDDVSPAEMFKLHLGSAEDRAIIAKYCVQDCALVLDLFKKLEIFNYAMSMANVCSVPVSYIFLRGQGIKIESLIFKYCYEKGYAVQVIGAPKGASASYEGAIVLTPTPQFATVPVGVADFASLYPSTMISENISFDTLVWVKDYDMEGRLMKVEWMSSYGHGSGSDDYDGLEGVEYTDIAFDLFIPDPEDTRKNPENKKIGTRICRYAQDSVGMVPQIVSLLLAARKAKREELKKTPDPFKKALLDSEQNAYKITANSLYGQLGSPTFKLRLQYLAASVTAYGRKQIMFARDVILRFYGEGQGNPRSDATIVYGDTDSLFVCFNPKDPVSGVPLEGEAALKETIHLTEEAGQLVTKALKAPHDFEFDKVYWPFLIFSKKRYVGHKYEELDHYTQASMGIALKRRDYAPIVKKVYGGAVEILLKEKDVPKAVDFVQRSCVELIQGKYGLGPLTISKSLRAEYANPQGVAHKVLADRMAARDQGTAPTIGDRVPFVYIQPPPGQQAADLQGDRIEHPTYIKEKGLKPDYMFYITNQISNPVIQMFGIMLERMPGYAGPPAAGWSSNPEKAAAQREAAAYEILFRDAINVHKNSAKSQFMSLFKSASGQLTFATKCPGESKQKSIPIVQPPRPQQKQTLLDQFFMSTVRVDAQKKIVKAMDKKLKKEEGKEA